MTTEQLDTLSIIARDTIDRQIGRLAALRSSIVNMMVDRYRESAFKQNFFVSVDDTLASDVDRAIKAIINEVG